ncbi:hypothetical protein GCM10023238_31790 [Streptomyces heliomycini]
MPRPVSPGGTAVPSRWWLPRTRTALVLAVPGAPSSATRSLADEVVSIARSELPGLDARIGYLDGDDEEFPSLTSVLAHAAGERTARFEQARAAGMDVKEPDGPVAVVVPLLAGPDSALLRQVRQAVMDSPCRRRADRRAGSAPAARRGAARAALRGRSGPRRPCPPVHRGDRGGRIILASVGGDEAVQAAGITGMLLAARLAVPVMAAALDQDGSIASVAEQLRGSGSQQLALAPYLIGPRSTPA